jgi:hypothetical protein
MHPYGLKEELVWLRAQGVSFGKISLELNVPKATLVMWANERNWQIAITAQQIREKLNEPPVPMEGILKRNVSKGPCQRFRLFGFYVGFLTDYG